MTNCGSFGVHLGYTSGNTDRHGVEGVDDGEAAGPLRLRRDIAYEGVNPEEEADLPTRTVLQCLRGGETVAQGSAK